MKWILVVLSMTWAIVGADMHHRDSVSMSRKAKTALTLNLLYPGVGHHLLGNRKKAFAYILGETLLLCSGIWSLQKGLAPVEEYSKQHAWAHAGANTEVDDPRYWEVMSYYHDVYSYNRDMYLCRTPELVYRDSENAWQWEDEGSQERYRALRRDEEKERQFRNSLRTVSVGIFAAGILNRIISTAHLAADIRNGRTIVASVSATVQTSFDPLSGSSLLTVEVSF